MKFKLIYEIDTKTMKYSVKLDDKGLTDEECFQHCKRALEVMSSHLLHNKPNSTEVN